jgi:hypothetical protein
MFQCHGHFQHFWDADTTELFWPEAFGYPTAAFLLLILVIPNVHSGTNLLSMIVYPRRDRFREKDISTLGSILVQFDMDPSTFFVHCQNARNTMLETFPKFNYEEFVLIVQPGANGESAHFTIPSLKSARLFIPIENTPTSLRVGSISQGTAFGAAGSKVFQGKGSGGKGGSGGNTKTSVKTYGFSGGAGGGDGIKTGGIGSGADVGGGSKTRCGSGGGGHTFRAPLALLSGHCTGVVGGACDANGVEMKRGWVAMRHTPRFKAPFPPYPGTTNLCWIWSDSRWRWRCL